MPTPLAVRTVPSPLLSTLPTAVPVAVSTAVLPLLRTPAAAAVLAVFPSAVYVRLASGAVLSLVTSDGLRLPNALVVAAPRRAAPFARCSASTRAEVADGALLLDGVVHRPVRGWTPRERTAGAMQPSVVRSLGELLAAAPVPHRGEVAQRLRTGTTRLATALRGSDGLAEPTALLVGLGPGLTPAGDDVLAGALVTCAHLGRPRTLGPLRPGATTALSADLLAHAAAGRAAPPVLDLLEALVGARPVGPALAGLLAVGSTSGHDTATGVLCAARALLEVA